MRLTLVGAILCAWGTNAIAALPFAYEMEVIVNPTGQYAIAADINDHGVVVGTMRQGSFRYSDGNFEELLPTVDADIWKVVGINNNGQMIILYSLATENDLIATALGSPETGYTLIPDFRATALNDNGSVVGVVREIGDARSDDQFAIYENGTLTVLGEGTPGAINNNGQFLVADYLAYNYCKVHFYSAGTLTYTGIDASHCEVNSLADDGTALIYASTQFDLDLPSRLFLYKDDTATLLEGLTYPWAYRNASGTIVTYAESAGPPIVWEDGDTVDVLDVTINPDPVFTDPGIISGMNARGQITINMDDADPDDDIYRTVILTPANSAPSFEPVSNQTVNENELLTIQLIGSDPEGDQLTYSGINLTPPDDDDSLARIGASLDPVTGLFSWTPSFDQAGNYEFEFIVRDDGEPSRLDLIVVGVSVGNVNRLPIFEDIPPVTASVGEELLIELQVTDPDGDFVDVTSEDLPVGATFSEDSRSIFWIPSADQVGVHIIGLVGTDRSNPPGSARATLTITVGEIFAPAELIDLIATTILDLNLPNGVEKKLIKPVQKIDKHFMKGKVDKAINEVLKFIDEVNTQLGDGNLDAETAAELIDLAEQLISVLGGEN